jgi:hybrid cluster-associated redox disulfide protein
MTHTDKTQPAAAAKEGDNPRTFDVNMSIQEAMDIHPRVREVFAAFHLGGCATCALGQFETIGQVCMVYGIDPDALLDVLESLVTEPPQAPQG